MKESDRNQDDGGDLSVGKQPQGQPMTRRSFVRVLGWTAATVTVIPLLDACTTAPGPGAASPSPGLATATPAAAGQPVPGGIMRVTLGAEPTTMDPAKASTLFDADVHDAIFEGLFSNRVYDPVTGALAESWETKDGVTWTIKLRRGTQFHDGTAVTSDAVKFSFDRISDPATGAAAQPKGRVAQIASTSAPDPGTVVFVLKKPSATFPLDLADIRVVPKNFDATKPVGTGPFAFVEWVRNQRVRVKKFPNYREQGLPYLDEVVFLPTPDENQKVVLLQTGQVDLIDTIPLPRVKELTDGGKIVVIGIEPGVSPSSYFMLLRTDKKPLDDPRVRQAINHAIDRKATLDVTFGVGTLKSSPIPPKNWAFSPAAPSYNQRDVAKAKQLLAEAGYPNGFTVQLKHITSRAEFVPIGQLFQANMAEAGIKVELVPQPLAVWIEDALNKHNFEIALTGVIPGPDPDAILTALYDQNQANGKMTAYKNADLQKLIEQGRATVNQEERKRIYAQAQQIIMTDVPAWPINERPILFGATPAVQGFKADVRQHLHFHSVWLKS